MSKEEGRNNHLLSRFIVIWAGQAVSLVGSNVIQFALIWWLTDLTGSGTVLAAATMAAVMPGVLLGPIAGAYVDRWNRRIVMLIADGFVALVSLWLAFLFWSESMQVWHVYAAMLLRAIGNTFHWPAMQASTSLMVPKRHLSRVAGFNQALNGALNIIGPPLGAMLMGIMPLHGIMLLDVGTALPAILPLLVIMIPQPVRIEGTKPTILTDVREAMRYVWGWKGLMMLIGMALAINFVLNPAFSLLPLLVKGHFGRGAVELGWIESAWGIGLVSGGVILGIWGGFKKRIYTSLSGIIAMGIGSLMMGLLPETAFTIAIGAMLMMGFMSAMANGPLIAIFQEVVAPEKQGRTFTLLNSLSMAIVPVGLAIAGPVSDLIGVRTWYIVGGVMCMVMGVVAFLTPAIVNIERSSKELGAGVITPDVPAPDVSESA